MQLGDKENIIKTLVVSGVWIDDIQMTTIYRTYPNVGNTGGGLYYYSGSALRYIGGGETRTGIIYGYTGHVLAAGLEMHFLCEEVETNTIP